MLVEPFWLRPALVALALLLLAAVLVEQFWAQVSSRVVYSSAAVSALAVVSALALVSSSEAASNWVLLWGVVLTTVACSLLVVVA